MNSGTHAQAGRGELAVEEATIQEVLAGYVSGATTAELIVEAYRERIRAYDRGGPRLNVVLFENPHAVRDARALDEALRRGGKLTGPLHGIPVLLKDNINTRDMPTTAGSQALAGYIPASDATVARKLRAAGAIILAKVNLHEFALWGETTSSLLGQTLNPYDLTRTPGGSSGGTGSGLAANFGLVGIGTDTVNSIRSPASATCLVGLRPTVGLVSRAGVIPYSFTQDAVGPMARTVADAARLLNVLVGHDPADAATADAAAHVAGDYTIHLSADGLQGKRIGVLRSLFGTSAVHAEVNRLIADALKDLSRLGASVIELRGPQLDSDQVTSQISVHLYELKPALNAYLQAGNAPVNSLSEILSAGTCQSGIAEILRQAQSLELDEAYRLRLHKRTQLQQQLMTAMAEARLDALVFPHQRRLVAAIGEVQSERNGALASVAGFPAIVVPAGFSVPTSTAPLGIPVGIEFLGKPWSEGVLLEIAYAYERGTAHRRAPATDSSLS
jgi:amidase